MAANSDQPESSSHTPSLKRGLGRLEATTLVVGHIIGTGIFLLPAAVADEVGTPTLALLAWLVAGLLAGAGALCFAELAAAIPRTGGTYAFLQRAYRSELLGFGFAWMMCFAYGAGAIAVVGIIAGTYLAPFAVRLGLTESEPVDAFAIGIIALLALINYLGVARGGKTQNLLTFVKVALMLAIIALPLSLLEPQPGLLRSLLPAGGGTGGVLASIGSAMIMCLFAYSGAYSVTHVAEEIREPQRNIPRAIITGFAIVLALYLAVNVAYLWSLPFDEARSAPRIAAAVMERVLGPRGADLTAVAIGLSAVGVLNAQLLNYPRIIFALARDGLFFSVIARIDSRTRTPALAILLVGTWAGLLVLSGSYRQILGYMAFVIHLFMTLAVAAVIVLRIREPQLPRPYRVWGYPWTPALFLAISAFYLVNLLVNELRTTIVGIGIVLAGLPFYAYFRRQRGPLEIA